MRARFWRARARTGGEAAGRGPRSGPARWLRFLTVGALTGGLAVPMLPAPGASAATFTLSATRASSGTAAADAASTCPTQGAPTPDAHCAGYDTSLAAIDQILRTGDRAAVRFDFNFDGADTGVVLRSTLPLAGSLPAATWTTPLPAACATGSNLTDSNRTLNCRIADPLGAGDGSITATLLLSGAAPDGTTFTVQGEISSSTSAPVASTGGATFTVSSAPFYDLRKNMTPNTLPAPFAYNAPDGTPGFAIPTPTGVAVAKAGGWSPLSGPVTWTETLAPSATGPAVDVSRFRLLNWGNYGQGCASQSTASTPANPGYPSLAVSISNQLSPAVLGQYTCSQPGGPGTAVTVSWNNPAVLASGYHAHAWIMFWVPAEDVPPGTSTVLQTASGFDPDDTAGVNNYFGNLEPTNNNARNSGTIVNEDNRTFNKYAAADGNPAASAQPNSISAVAREARFQTVLRFSNTGTVSQTPVRICDAFDSTVQQLTAFDASPNYPANSYALAVTQGPPDDPILAPAYRPAASYNNTNNFLVDPSAYTVEFAAGDFDIGPPTNAPQSGPSMGASGTAAGCADAGTATGWHTDPNDPAIVAYAQSLGLSDPFDVVNRVRVTFTGGAIQPRSYVGVKLRFTVRATYREATTQAGETVLATTRIGDVGAFEYPQSTVDPWTSTALAGPTVAGRIGVDTAVSKVASPTNVQAGAPGQNRTTYTITSAVGFGEDVAPVQPVRIVDHLPTGMRYVAGSANIPPDHVLVQPDRSTIIVWDRGDITGTTNSSTALPPITFQAEADPLAPTPSSNYNVVISESVAPDGTALDTDPPIAACGTMLQYEVPPTPNVPVPTIVDMPPPTNYSGCAGQGRIRRMGYATVTIGNAFLELGAAKTALAGQVEPNSADGVAGAEVGWDLTITNTTSNDLLGIDIVDVLPYDGDTRSPGSSFSGDLQLTSLQTSDPLSVTPNALPTNAAGPFPARAGTTFYVTAAAPATIDEDPYAAPNLAGGATTWCLLSQLGDAGCPATLADSTAVRIISGSLATLASRSARIGVATTGNADDDVYTNDAAARAIGVTSLVPVAGDTITVVASAIAGTVWHDADANGVVDAGETGIVGVDVDLTGTASDGSPVALHTTTGGDGGYLFPDLRSGSYTVTVDQATVRGVNAAYAITFDPQHETTAPTGVFDVELALNSTINARNVGFATQSLSGVVFDDLDNDGAQGAGEEGNAGVDVTITGTDDLGGPVSRTVSTGTDGTFTFADLRPGTYALEKVQLPATVAGKSTAGTAGGTADGNEIAGITLGTGDQATGYRFGELPPEIIAGVVFADDDGDGVRDPAELGIADVTIDLTGTDTFGDPVALSARTQADGSFTFAGLRPGTYTLTETQPAGYLQGVTATNGSVGAVAGDVISGIAVAGANAMGYTFAELTGSSISGVVFEDLDADGALGAAEPPLVGVSVELSGEDSGGDPITPIVVITADDGTYTFGGLRPGTYVLTATDGAGLLDGRETAGSVGGTVDNSAPGSNTISDIALGVAVDAVGYSFADVRAGAIGATVFVDRDGDGVQGPGEGGIAGVTVALTGTDDFGAAVSLTPSTAADGSVSFPGLRPGTYTLTETQPAPYLQGITATNGAVGSVAGDVISDIVVAGANVTTGYTFAERQPVSIAGTVFADLDGDGIHDATEPGISGVTIELLDDTDTAIDLATTAPDGTWQFTGLLSGTYGVREVQPAAGYANGVTVAGSSGGTVAADAVTGIELTGDATGYLFGEIPLSAITGTVWHDADDDGVHDGDEDPLAGVEVTLGGDAASTTTTGADGRFTFADLEPGAYTLTEAQPADWIDGRTVIGAAGGSPSAVNVITDIVLGADEYATGYGFAERTAALDLTVRTQTQIAPVPTGPKVLVGGAVRWTYEVTNDGDAALSGLVVEDDRLGTVTCPTTDLAPRSSITCLATGTAVAGQYTNQVTARATVVPPAATPAPPLELEATATSHHFGVRLGATLIPRINGGSAASAPGPRLAAGTPAVLAVTLTNTGNVPLTPVWSDAGALGAPSCTPAGPVAPGSSVVCSTTATPAPGPHAGTAAFRLTGPDGVAPDGVATASTLEVDTPVHFRVDDPTPVNPDTDGDGLLDDEETNEYGTDPNVPNAVSYGLTKFVPLQPVRVLDTRNGIAWDGGMPAAGTTLTLPVRGRSGVPDDPQVKAVVLNVTATDADAWGYVTAYPGGIDRPEVSNVNVDQVGESIANLVTVPVGPDGTVRLYTSAATHLLADVAGYYVGSVATTDGRLRPVTPARLLDTRDAQIGYSGPKPIAGETITLDVAGRGGVPAAGAAAVVLTVTIADSDAWGYVTAYPGGTARPEASNVNVHRAGQTVANQVIVPIGADGTVRLYTSAGLHLVADVTGWFTDPTAESSFSGLFVPVAPVRKLDTRLLGEKTSADGTITVFTLPGTIPGVAAAAAAVNVTATETDGPGYVTAFPAGVDLPDTSVLNVEGGDETIADHVIAPVTAGDLTLYSYAGAHLVADVVGWFRE